MKAAETEREISSPLPNLDGLEAPIVGCLNERRSSRLRLCMNIGPFGQEHLLAAQCSGRDSGDVFEP